MAVKPKKKPEEVKTNAGVQNVPVTTTSGTSVIVPAKEAQKLARIGKVQESQVPAGDVTKHQVSQDIAKEQIKEGLPEQRVTPSSKEAFPDLRTENPLSKQQASTATVKSALEGKFGSPEAIVANTKRMREAGMTPEQMFPEDTMSQGLLRLDLNEKDLAVLKSGEAEVSRLTQAVEAIPIIPGRLRTWAGVFATSEKKFAEIETELSTAEKNIADWSKAAADSPQFQEEFLNLIAQTEDRMLWLESKLKIIALQSPDLQAQPEKLDATNQKILGLKLSARNAKFKAQGIIA